MCVQVLLLHYFVVQIYAFYLNQKPFSLPIMLIVRCEPRKSQHNCQVGNAAVRCNTPIVGTNHYPKSSIRLLRADKTSFRHLQCRFSVTMEPHCALKPAMHLFKNSFVGINAELSQTS